MKKKPRSNAWELKSMKLDQRRYFMEQNRKNELLVETLEGIGKAMGKMQAELDLSVKQVDHNLSEKLETSNRKTMEFLQTLYEDINQTQELVKILVANQLIDQI